MHRQKVSINSDLLTELSLQKEPQDRQMCGQTTQEEHRDVT